MSDTTKLQSPPPEDNQTNHKAWAAAIGTVSVAVLTWFVSGTNQSDVILRDVGCHIWAINCPQPEDVFGAWKAFFIAMGASVVGGGVIQQLVYRLPNKAKE